MSTYPVMYAQDPPEQRNRLTIFFRGVMAIPHFIWLMIYGIGFFFAVFIAWWAIVFTGKWPKGLYDFSAGFLRYSTRVMAYYMCVVDEYPPFDGGEHPEYPVKIAIAPPLPEYNRVKAFFRIILAIPIIVINYVMQLWIFAVAIALWFVGVFAGKTSPGLTDAARLPMAYIARSNAYMYLLTEDWPPFDPGPPVLVSGPAGQPLDAGPERL
jgi:uncharacterized membrane protein